MGVLVGTALATKITALPLLLLPLIVLANWRERGLFVLAAVAAAILFIAPAWGHLDGFRFLIGRIATHQGRYGEGRTALLDLEDYAGALMDLIASSPLIAAAIVLTAIAIALSQRTGPQLRSRLCLPALLVVQVAFLLFVARHPGTTYLVPAFSLTGFTIALAIFSLWRSVDHRRLRRGFVVVITAITIGLGLSDVADLWRKTSAARHAQIEVVTRTQAYGIPTIIYYYRASSPAFALHFGNLFASGAYSSQINALFPRAIYFDRWNQVLQTYGKAASNRLSDSQAPLLLQGTPFTPEQLKRLPFPATLLFSNGVEALYKIR